VQALGDAQASPGTTYEQFDQGESTAGPFFSSLAWQRSEQVLPPRRGRLKRDAESQADEFGSLARFD
jgi:hypothetical protein